MTNDLPEPVRQAIAQAQAERQARMSAFANVLISARKEAMSGREASGIERVWLECEEAYLGIDDENRNEFDGAAWAKPTTMSGPLTRRSNSSDGVRATAFVRLTSRYVDAGTAKICEIVLPVDGKAFALNATPVANVTQALEDKSQVQVDGQPQRRQAKDGDQGVDEQGEVPLTVADLAKAQQAKADDAADEAEDIVYDWMVEYGHAREMRKVLFDSARIGAGVLKGPVPEQVKSMARTEDGLKAQNKTIPAARWTDPWNLFPDPACGEDIHAGSYLFERFFLTKRQLEDLRGKTGYLRESIDQVLAQGPDKQNEHNQNPGERDEHRQRWTGWLFHGQIDAAELELHNPRLFMASETKRSEKVYAVVTMVNDLPIHVTVSPQASGRFPYNTMAWRRRAGHWAGVGVAEQARMPQRLINAASRSMINNAAKSAGSIIVLDAQGIEGEDGNNKLLPDKVFRKTADAVGDDVRKMFSVFQVPNVTPQLMEIIQYAFRLAEESTNIPLITQGQSGDTTPDTFGAAQMQNNNANQLLRDVGMAVADSLTEPLVQDLYEYLLLDPDVPDSAKGDFQIDVSGSIALIEKAIQDQTIAALLPVCKDPAFGLNPKLVMQEFLRSKRLNPTSLSLTEDELSQLAKAEPPKAPQVQAAEIRAQAQVAVAESRDHLAAKKIEVDTDRDTSYVESMQRRDAASAQAKQDEMRLRYQLAVMEYANRERITLETAKSAIAQTVMELTVQRELAGLEDEANPAAQVATPAMEPAGRAPDGQAFQA